MCYIVDNDPMKAYLQARHQLHMNFTYKCMGHEAYKILQLPQCYI